MFNLKNNVDFNITLKGLSCLIETGFKMKDSIAVRRIFLHNNVQDM